MTQPSNFQILLFSTFFVCKSTSKCHWYFRCFHENSSDTWIIKNKSNSHCKRELPIRLHSTIFSETLPPALYDSYERTSWQRVPSSWATIGNRTARLGRSRHVRIAHVPRVIIVRREMERRGKVFGSCVQNSDHSSTRRACVKANLPDRKRSYFSALISWVSAFERHAIFKGNWSESSALYESSTIPKYFWHYNWRKLFTH